MELKRDPQDGNVTPDNSYYQTDGQTYQSTNQSGQGYNQQYNQQFNQQYNQQAPGYYTESANGYWDAAWSEVAGNNASQAGMNVNGYSYSDNNGSFAGNTMAAMSTAMMNSVLVNAFFYMFIALLVTAITALIVAANPEFYLSIISSGRLGFFLLFGIELGLVFGCTTAMKSNNFALSALLFGAFSIVNGITFSVIFLVFQLSSIVTVFFMTSVIFGVMALYGAVTKRDLTGWGPILFAGLIAVLIGSLINIFLGSTMADLIFTVLGVAVFTAYTAYDVNKIVKMSKMNTGLSVGVLGMYGAMELYLDFINLFLKLLRLFGKRK